MIELKTQLVLAFAWIVLCFTVGKCNVYPNSTYFQECERQCHKPPKDSRVSEVRFLESVLNLFPLYPSDPVPHKSLTEERIILQRLIHKTFSSWFSLPTLVMY